MSGMAEYPQKADFHVHTVFCDGQNTAEEMVQAAIERGFTALGFSGHAPMPFETDWCMTEARAADYRKEILRLRDAYAGKIRIYLGIEQDYFSEAPTDEYDYVIGSVHYVKKDDVYLCIDESPAVLQAAIDEHYGGDFDALAEDYYVLVADVANKTGADIIGHFDLVTKFSERGIAFDAESPRYTAAWRAAADALIETDVPFEINTGAMSRGYRLTPYPAQDVMRYLASHGGCAVLSSDSHRADTLGNAFAGAAAQAGTAKLPLVRKIGKIEF